MKTFTGFEWFVVDGDIYGILDSILMKYADVSQDIKNIFILEMCEDHDFFMKHIKKGTDEMLKMWIYKHYSVLK